MKRLLLAISSAVVALVLPGCLQSETTITLNKDGSGTLVEQTTLGPQIMAMLSQFAALGGDPDADPLDEIFSEEKARAKAASLGEGVTFEKSEPVGAGPNKGARVTYAFADINKLKVTPGDTMKDISPVPGQAPAAAADVKPSTCNYADGTLTIVNPDPEKPDLAGVPADAEVPDIAGNPEMEAMMKEMLADMKVSFKIVAPAGIEETNATHRDGNTITLMEMEMGKLLEKPETFKKLAAVDQKDPAAAMEALKGLEGVKMEAKPKITVKLD